MSTSPQDPRELRLGQDLGAVGRLAPPSAQGRQLKPGHSKNLGNANLGSRGGLSVRWAQGPLLAATEGPGARTVT